jgi:diaminopimelate decarboxylase
MPEPSPWPASARWDAAGLSVGGVPAGALAERFGTPLLVFDEHDLRERMRSMRGHVARVAYAVKAMTCAAVILWIRREDADDMDRLDVILETPWEASGASAARGEGGT